MKARMRRSEALLGDSARWKEQTPDAPRGSLWCTAAAAGAPVAADAGCSSVVTASACPSAGMIQAAAGGSEGGEGVREVRRWGGVVAGGTDTTGQAGSCPQLARRYALKPLPGGKRCRPQKLALGPFYCCRALAGCLPADGMAAEMEDAAGNRRASTPCTKAGTWELAAAIAAAVASSRRASSASPSPPPSCRAVGCAVGAAAGRCTCGGRGECGASGPPNNTSRRRRSPRRGSCLGPHRALAASHLLVRAV